MPTLPAHDLRRASSEEPTSHRRLWIGLGVAGVVLVLVYSGVAWTWVKPAFQKDLINKYAYQYHFDPLWVMAIIQTESGFAPWARSSRGAVGLMQLLPSTANDIAPEIGMKPVTAEELRNPDINVRLGVYYLSKLERMFPDDRTALLSAYNAGPGITQQWRKGKPVLDLEDIAYPETRQFVLRVERSYRFLKTIQRWKHFFGLDHGN
jgi:soluble lytic murein transglycosylase